MRSAAALLFTLAALAPAARADVVAPTAPSPPHEFLGEAKALLAVGACAQLDGPPPAVKEEILAAHCKAVRAAQDEYKASWVAVARPFFAEHVPHDLPKTVVYPFAGGDLSLEPAGDPTALAHLDDKELKSALAVVAKELASLYRANFSVTMNMISAMRGGRLPTQLIFGLSALSIQGYEPVSLRYFRLSPSGAIEYLTDADVARIAGVTDVGKRNREYANIELRFKKHGETRVQTYRHIQANLDDAHLKKDPSALLHLQQKGAVAGMTKAASYLLSFDDFKTMRQYIIDHVVWMVSDTTGLPPTYGRAAGFDYETYGEWGTPNMAAGKGIAGVWHKEFDAQPKRPLAFRFGYPDMKLHGHLVIMKKAAAARP
jgi:hypothetical protein